MSQPPDKSAPRWSPDRLWWWDGERWIPANQAAPVGYVPPPPPPPGYLAPPPSAAYSVPPPPVAIPAPSPGLRVFLLVFLIVTSLLAGVFVLAGILAVTTGPTDTSSIVFLLLGAAIFGLSLAATIGVAVRTRWARIAAIAAGLAVSLTCLGLVLGIPILVASARAPLAPSKPPGEAGA